MHHPGKKIALVCSSGGHFLELYSLKTFWGEFDRFWVTFRRGDTLRWLKNEEVYFAFSPTNRNLKNLIRNLTLAALFLIKERPSVLVTTGAGVGVPFIYMARLLCIKTIYIESITRVRSLSLSAKLVYFVADELIVQWPELTRKYRRAKFFGQVI